MDIYNKLQKNKIITETNEAIKQSLQFHKEDLYKLNSEFSNKYGNQKIFTYKKYLGYDIVYTPLSLVNISICQMLGDIYSSKKLLSQITNFQDLEPIDEAYIFFRFNQEIIMENMNYCRKKIKAH